MSRIEALLTQMTLAEKLGQLTMSSADQAVTGPIAAQALGGDVRSGAVGSVLNLFGSERVRSMQRLAVEESRLHIPLFFGFDVIHGYRTLFPVPLAETASFDRDLWEETAREAAKEAAREGLDMTFAPMLDVSRDPRWGRTVEGPGEDPVVGRALARAKVRGIQGMDLAAPDAMAAVAKHFCAYGPVQAGREYASVDISERSLLEVHLPAFVAAIDGGVVAVMPAFTDLAGIPMTAHRKMLCDLLRARLGFQGVVVSDYNAIGELMAHGVAADLVEAAALALRAGIDIDMMANAYRHGLGDALARGLVTQRQIDEAVLRVLRLKERLGLFEDPYRRCQTPEPESARGTRRRLARRAAAQSLVLLTHRNSVLPLRVDLRRLALIGPLADAPAEMRGSWTAAADEQSHVGVVEGLRAALPAACITHVRGVDILASEGSGAGQGLEEALSACDEAEAIILCVGERGIMSGEAASRAELDLPGRQRELAESILERAATRSIPVVALLFSGRPLVVPWLFERADAVVAAWFPGSEAGHGIADVLTGRVSPSARLPISWPRSVGQIPIFYAQRPSGRPYVPGNHYTSQYLDVANEPQFPLGHGLSYGQFELSNLRATPAVVSETDTVEVRVDVHNISARAARETVFLFAHDKLASVARPVLELKNWQQIDLDAGGHATVVLHVSAQEFRLFGVDLNGVDSKTTFEAGEVELLVGPRAQRSELLSTTVRLRQP